MPWFGSSKKNKRNSTLAKTGKQAFKDVVHHGSQNLGEIRQPARPWRSLSLTDDHQPILMPRENIIITSEKLWPHATYAHDKDISVACTCYLTNRRVLSVEYGTKLAKPFGQFIMISDVTEVKDDCGGTFYTTSYRFTFRVGKSQQVVMKFKRADAKVVLKEWLKQFSSLIKAHKNAANAAAVKKLAQEAAAKKARQEAAKQEAAAKKEANAAEAKNAAKAAAAKKAAEDAAALKAAKDAAAKQETQNAARREATDSEAAQKAKTENLTIRDNPMETVPADVAAVAANTAVGEARRPAADRVAMDKGRAAEDAVEQKAKTATKAADVTATTAPVTPQATELQDDALAPTDNRTINVLLEHVSATDYVEAATNVDQAMGADRDDSAVSASKPAPRPCTPPQAPAQGTPARGAPGTADKAFLLTYSEMTQEQQKSHTERIRRKRQSLVIEQMAEYEAFKNHTQGERIAVPHKGDASPKGEVILLLTSLRYNMQVHTDCNGLRQLLARNKIAFVEIDGIEHDNLLERTRLFALSGKHGLYPQLFCGGSFIGGAYEVMEMDEDGTLRDELGMEDIEDDDDNDSS